MTAIRLENVSKRFGSASGGCVDAVQNMSLTVNSGEFFTFVGPSGCGKSTALNLIAGLESATSGEILFDDKQVTDLPPKDRDVAMVFQSYALYPHLTVFDNIAFPLQLRKTSKNDQKKAVAKISATLGLETLLDRKPKALSGGQRQRVALARALIRRPRVFLMDEPLSNLDARLRLEMRAEIRRIFLEEKITTIYVTHDQEEAMVLSDRLAVMRDGSIEQCATPLEMYQNPQSQFVAEFIGNPPINMLEGEQAAKIFTALGEQIGDFADKVHAGIRPTGVTVCSDAQESHDTPSVSGEATVRLIEMTGADCWAHLESMDCAIRAKVPAGTEIREGSRVKIVCASEDFMYFAKSDGARHIPRGQTP